MTKSDQLHALREARLKKPNQFEDAARGRDPAPKPIRDGVERHAGKESVPGRTSVELPPPTSRNEKGLRVSSPARESKSKARYQAVRPTAHNRSTAGSNPAAPTKSKRVRVEVTLAGLKASPFPADQVFEAKRPVGRPKIEGPRPWEKLGISRRTWYRSRESEK